MKRMAHNKKIFYFKAKDKYGIIRLFKTESFKLPIGKTFYFQPTFSKQTIKYKVITPPKAQSIITFFEKQINPAFKVSKRHIKYFKPAIPSWN